MKEYIYPKFKKLELSDLGVIEQFTKKYEPYSNFGFSSLYTWNTDDKTTFSFLNNNLILRRKDYVEDRQIYSLLGNNKLDQTVDELVKITDELKLVPHLVAQGLRESKLFTVVEDINNHDYVLSIDKIVSLEGSIFKKRRSLIKKARELHRNFSIVIMDPSSIETRNEVIGLFDKWVSKKRGILSKEDEKNERIAVIRLYQLVERIEIIMLGLYINNILAGFFCVDVQSPTYVTALFVKGDISFGNVYDFLFYESLKYLQSRGYKYLNFEMDLGIEGLRFYKRSWRPIAYLKHYIIKKNR